MGKGTVEAETENPWLREPNIDRFQAYGFRCVLRRSMPMEVWCGYVGLRSSHPLYGLDRDTKSSRLEYSVDRRLNGKVRGEELGLGLLLNILTGTMEPTLSNIIRVHGGLTFSDKGGQYKDDFLGRGFWWVGFDCGHGWDYMPGLHERFKENPFDYFGTEDFKKNTPYRTYEYAREETIKLAAQLSIFR